MDFLSNDYFFNLCSISPAFNTIETFLCRISSYDISSKQIHSTLLQKKIMVGLIAIK